MKSGFVGIIGRPNVGKSTLLNAILGEKIAITTSKPQTTRNTIRGIYNGSTDDGEDLQIVFIDTPGIHKGRNKLGSAMTEAAISTFKEVDVVLFLVDDELSSGPGDRYIAEQLRDLDTPVILVINKVDIIEPDKFKRIFEEYEAIDTFDRVMGISAAQGTHVDELLDAIAGYLEAGPRHFPDDMITDHPEKFIVSELIREKLLLYMDDEIPHGTAVEIDKYTETDRLTRIYATIYCEKKSHKGMIIGRQGKKLKGIGKSARTEIEALLGTKVYLELWVKVKENWRDSDLALSNFGYKDNM